MFPVVRLDMIRQGGVLEGDDIGVPIFEILTASPVLTENTQSTSLEFVLRTVGLREVCILVHSSLPIR